MKQRDCTIRVAKTKALISFAVTAKLICVFVFAYTKCLFSHEAAYIIQNAKWSTKFGLLLAFCICTGVRPKTDHIEKYVDLSDYCGWGTLREIKFNYKG